MQTQVSAPSAFCDLHRYACPLLLFLNFVISRMRVGTPRHYCRGGMMLAKQCGVLNKFMRRASCEKTVIGFLLHLLFAINTNLPFYSVCSQSFRSPLR